MKRFLVLLQTLALVLGLATVQGCEAEPDQDTMGELRDTIASFPIELKTVMSRWAANRVAYGYCLSYPQDMHLGRLQCVSPVDGSQPEFIIITLREMIRCLSNMGTTTYAECLNVILQDHEDQNADKDYECHWESFNTHFEKDHLPQEFESERISNDDLAWHMIGTYPPPKEIQLMLLGLGMMGRGGVLCVQSVDWACVDNPLDEDPGTTTGSGSPGGDK